MTPAQKRKVAALVIAAPVLPFIGLGFLLAAFATGTMSWFRICRTLFKD